MEMFLNNLIIMFQNALITVWYWSNIYRWELLFLALMFVALFLDHKEMKVFFVDDKRKVV